MLDLRSAGLDPEVFAARLAVLAKDRKNGELLRLREILLDLERRQIGEKWRHYFPDETHEFRGDKFWARELYAPHLEHFAAGARYPERMFRAANRTGKTVAGAYESTAHLTGRYPHWWVGKRFTRPTLMWAAGKTNESTRDVIQEELLGRPVGVGINRRMSGGMIPAHDLGKPTWRQGVANLVDTVTVRHVSGGWSRLGLKTYEQGRGSFEGTQRDCIWLDEEPPMDVYQECLIRTMTRKGIIFVTFMPLEGQTDVVLSFMPKEGD
jgi:phage terminase large subunit-like protein